MEEAELRQLLVELLEASNHPEIVKVKTQPDRGEEGWAGVHTKFHDDSSSSLYIPPPSWKGYKTNA